MLFIDDRIAAIIGETSQKTIMPDGGSDSEKDRQRKEYSMYTFGKKLDT